jgi:hypothetical protein
MLLLSPYLPLIMALIFLYLYLNIYLGRLDHFVVIYSARYFRFGTSNNLKKLDDPFSHREVTGYWIVRMSSAAISDMTKLEVLYYTTSTNFKKSPGNWQKFHRAVGRSGSGTSLQYIIYPVPSSWVLLSWGPREWTQVREEKPQWWMRK